MPSDFKSEKENLWTTAAMEEKWEWLKIIFLCDDYITTFKVVHCWALFMGGAYMHFIDAWISDKYLQPKWYHTSNTMM